MTDEKKWKVYCYTNRVNGKKYVGVTCTSLAARSGRNGKKYLECPYFGHAIQKYGWGSFLVEVLARNLSESEVGKYEDFYIQRFHTRNPKYGYNIRSGGFDKAEFSEEGRKRFIETHSGKNSVRSKRTAVYNLSGKLVQVFDTATEAADFLGVTDVTESCKAKRGTIANHIVRYESDYPGISQLPDSEIYRRYDFRLLYKPVNQYDLNGHYLKTFSSATDAAAEVSPNGKGKSSICASLKGTQRTAYGFMWKYAEGEDCSDISPLDPYAPKSGDELPQSVRVRQLSLDGTVIAEFGSIREAHRKTGISENAIQLQLSGKTKKPIKYRWERIE